MEFIRTIREKQETKRQHNLRKQSEEVITLSDFAGTLYIACQGIPIIEIKEDWTTKDIVEQLGNVRQNYIKHHQPDQSYVN